MVLCHLPARSAFSETPPESHPTDWGYWTSHEPTTEQKLYGIKAPTSAATRDRCAACGKTSADSLKQCSQCKSISYCSKSCQQAHWSKHKPNCRRPMKEETSADSSALDGARDACATCGSTSDTLKRCTRCKKVSYCDRKCQLVDWPQHKHVCGSQ